MKRLQSILCLDDFEAAARDFLPRQVFTYIVEAAETRSTLAGNRAAFRDWWFVPRILIDVSGGSQRMTLLGREFASAFGIAPMGISALSAYRGDHVLAGAAGEADIPMIMSSSSLIPLEDLARDHPHAWFQAYLPGEPARITALVERVARAGFQTLMLTADVAVLSNRENTIRAGFSLPLRPSVRLAWDGISHPRWLLGTALRTLLAHGMPHFENSFAERGAPILSRNVERDFSKRDHLNWAHLDLIRRQWKGRLVVKGIMSPEDARIARERGVDGIVVSNHGGRQLDGTVSPLRVLPAIAAVAGGMTLMMDSGVRRGTDVLKAIALGAKFVFVGRPFNYAASVGGEAGVLHAAEILRGEVYRNMALVGVNSLAEVGPDRLMPVDVARGR